MASAPFPLNDDILFLEYNGHINPTKGVVILKRLIAVISFIASLFMFMLVDFVDNSIYFNPFNELVSLFP